MINLLLFSVGDIRFRLFVGVFMEVNYIYSLLGKVDLKMI